LDPRALWPMICSRRKTAHGRRAEPPAQPLDETGALALARPLFAFKKTPGLRDGRLERPGSKAQRLRRRRQGDALELVAQQLEQPRTLPRALEQLDAVRRRRNTCMLEDEPHPIDLRLADLQLARKTLD